MFPAETHVQVVLEVLLAPLGENTHRNPELMYALLQRQQVLEPFAGHSRFGASAAFLKVWLCLPLPSLLWRKCVEGHT